MTCLTSKHITERLLLSMTLLLSLQCPLMKEDYTYFLPGKHKELRSENVEKNSSCYPALDISPTSGQ